MTDALSVLARREFPRSGRFDPDWVMDNQMGPNPLWLVEWLCESVSLTPGMRVLDLGCGTALTSIFLARELGVQVVAADLWVDPEDNWRRAVDQGVGDRVTPLRVEAHALPFPERFFDAVVSVDAYHYFGTDELYLGYLARFVADGGQIAVVVPGLARPLPAAGPPAHLTAAQANGAAFWEDECITFHTAEWWADLWCRSHRVEQVAADTMPDGWKHWRDFERALEAARKCRFPSVAETLERDAGEYVAFVRVVGRRVASPGLNLYDSALLRRLPPDVTPPGSGSSR